MNRKLWLKFRWILNILNRSPNPKAPAKWMYKLTNSAVAMGGLCSSWTVCSSTVQPSRMEEQMNVHMGLKSKRKKKSHVPCFCLPSSCQSCCWFCCHLCFTRLLHVCGVDKELRTQKTHTTNWQWSCQQLCRDLRGSAWGKEKWSESMSLCIA